MGRLRELFFGEPLVEMGVERTRGIHTHPVNQQSVIGVFAQDVEGEIPLDGIAMCGPLRHSWLYLSV